jgi:hypothetical protein
MGEEKIAAIFSPEVEQEILKVVPEWADLKAMNGGFTSVHSLLVIWLAVREPLFLSLDPPSQNILKWASLFHDITKRGFPIFEKQDHIHPFRGGGVFLDILTRLGKIENSGDLT